MVKDEKVSAEAVVRYSSADTAEVQREGEEPDAEKTALGRKGDGWDA